MTSLWCGGSSQSTLGPSPFSSQCRRSGLSHGRHLHLTDLEAEAQRRLQVAVKYRFHELQLSAISVGPQCLPRLHSYPVTAVGAGPCGDKIADGLFSCCFPGSYECGICGKKYKYYNCFQTHVRAHRGDWHLVILCSAWYPSGL